MRLNRHHYNPATVPIRFDSLIDEQRVLAAENIRLAFAMAKRWRGQFRTLTDDEMESGCLEGLCKAAKKFREERGYRFSTYATSSMYTTLLSMVDRQRAKESTCDDFTEAVDTSALPDFELIELVDNLPVVYRAIVRQKFFEGMKDTEIGRLHGESGPWVRNRLGEAMDMLRAAYGEEPQ